MRRSLDFAGRATARLPFKTPVNLRLRGRELPVGLLGPGLIVGVSALAMIAIGDVASIAAGALIAALGLWFTVIRRNVEPADVIADDETRSTCCPSAELSLDQIEARPGNVLVPVRNPHSLAHVAAALQTSGDRDIVVMTARLLDVDVSEEAAGQSTPTPYERRLLSEVVALAERHRSSGAPPHRPRPQRRRRDRRHRPSSSLVRRVRGRIVDALRRGSSTSAGRGLGARRQA